MSLIKLLAALPHLKQTELATLRAAIDHLLVHRVDDLDTTSPLYAAMAKLLGVGLSYRDFHNVVSFKTWRKSAPAVVSFIEATFPTATKVAKIAMMTFLLEALIDDLKSRGVPITLGTVTINLDRLPQLFDSAFPDYRQAGMSHLVIEAMKKRGV